MERTLQQRSSQYERPVSAAALAGNSNSTFADMGQLRELIRSVVREELQKFGGQASPVTVGSLTSVVRDEVHQAFSALPPRTDAFPAVTEPVRPTYAESVRQPTPVGLSPTYAAPQAAVLQTRPVAFLADRRRKTDVWRAPDRRPLCYHCGEAGHIYRQCPYRELGLRGFGIDAPRPRPGQRPRDIEEYLARQRSSVESIRRPSRSPSPRRPAADRPRYDNVRSPSPRREN